LNKIFGKSISLLNVNKLGIVSPGISVGKIISTYLLSFGAPLDCLSSISYISQVCIDSYNAYPSVDLLKLSALLLSCNIIVFYVYYFIYFVLLLYHHI